MEQKQARRPAPGRNEPCRCGSGRKTKRCCGTEAPAAASPAETHLARGNELLRAGRAREASLALVKSLRTRPESPDAANSLGVALAAMGEHERAIVCYAQALALRPENAPALSNMGSSLQTLGRTAEAIGVLERALVVDPNFAATYVNLGRPLQALGRYPEAAQAAQCALALQPRDVEAWLNLGNALKEQGRLAEAVSAYEQAVAAQPRDARAYNNLGETLRDQDRVPEAVAAFHRALAAQPIYPEAYSNLLYLHAFTRDILPGEELLVARGWERACVPESQRAQARAAMEPGSGAFRRTPRTGRKLRLGIVSAELGTHAVAEFLEPFVTHLSRDRFHVTLFPVAGRFDRRAERFRGLADDFVPLVGSSNEVAAQRIREAEIDVLLDTSGHTTGNRLGVFARRAAPVQCTYIGYWSTTGLTEMDWFVSDGDAPANAGEGFSEGLWRLPRIAVCYRGDPSLRHDLWTPAPVGSLRLGCFNKYAKIREETLVLWAEVLRAMPESRLILEDRGTEEGETHARILGTLGRLGVAPERVTFIPYVPGHERHMSLYNEIDIALDTVPFNSGTTAFDALWMGVPLVTVEGNWIGGRMGGSVLRALGRPEWIAPDAEGFVRVVGELAAHRNRLCDLRRGLREEMAASPLCDAPGLARALEEAFCGMFDRWWEAQEG